MQKTSTVLHEITRTARLEPARPALTDLADGTTVTYRELLRAAQAYAETAPPSTHHLLALPPGIALVVAVLGAWRSGATAIVVDSRAPLPEREPYLNRFPDAHVVQELDPTHQLAAKTRELPEPTVRPDDVAVILGTSGTSGVPKLVPLSHGNLFSSFTQTNRRLPYATHERVISGLPAFHIAGLNLTLLQPLAAGVHVLIQPRFEPESFLHAAQTHRATRTNLVPRMADMLVESAPRGADLSAMTISSGGSALYPATAEAFAARFGTPLLPGYGLTETCALTHHTSPGDDRSGEGVVGRPLPETEHRIVDDDGVEVPPGEVGAVMLRGPQITRGYLGAEPFPDGWLSTGDLGRVDERGRLSILGRRSELIDYNAHLISPTELESHLLKHPAVLDAAVIGRRSEAHGEIPVGVVVLDRDVPVEELFEAVRSRVSPHKRLRGIAVVDAIPRTPSGKPLRRELRDLDLRIVTS